MMHMIVFLSLMKIPKLARRVSQSIRDLISMYVCMYIYAEVYLFYKKKTITIDFMESYTGCEKEIQLI